MRGSCPIPSAAAGRRPLVDENVPDADHLESSAAGGAERGRIRAAALGERLVLGARAGEQSDHPVVSLVTPRLLVEPIRLVALPGELLLERPRSRPRRRIVE